MLPFPGVVRTQTLPGLLQQCLRAMGILPPPKCHYVVKQPPRQKILEVGTVKITGILFVCNEPASSIQHPCPFELSTLTYTVNPF